MDNLINALEQSLRDGNYISALMVAVTLPDICGKIEYGGGSQTRYVRWYSVNMREMYQRGTVTGDDAYGIRCALLHAFSNDLDEQRAVQALKHLKFTITGAHFMTIANSSSNIDGLAETNPPTVLLNAKKYVEDILDAYKKWHENISRETLGKLASYPFIEFNATYLVPGIRISN
jgi:hypothetical protein